MHWGRRALRVATEGGLVAALLKVFCRVVELRMRKA